MEVTENTFFNVNPNLAVMNIEAAEVIVTHNHLHSFSSNGIQIKSSGSVKVMHNIIEHGGNHWWPINSNHAIDVQPLNNIIDKVVVSSNIIRNLTSNVDIIGVSVDGTSNLLLENNTIMSIRGLDSVCFSRKAASAFGIQITTCKDVLLINNILSNW